MAINYVKKYRDLLILSKTARIFEDPNMQQDLLREPELNGSLNKAIDICFSDDFKKIVKNKYNDLTKYNDQYILNGILQSIEAQLVGLQNEDRSIRIPSDLSKQIINLKGISQNLGDSIDNRNAMIGYLQDETDMLFQDINELKSVKLRTGGARRKRKPSKKTKSTRTKSKKSRKSKKRPSKGRSQKKKA